MAHKKIHLLLLTAGHTDHPSSRTRATQFISAFKDEGYRVCWIPRVGCEPKNFRQKILFSVTKRLYYLKVRLNILLGKWDAVMIQRTHLEPFFLNYLKKKSVPVLFDFDDALYLQPNDQRNGRSLTGLMVENASAVVVSTPFLTPFCNQYGKNPVIIPTSVNGNEIVPALNNKSNEVPVIGWLGSSTTTITIRDGEEGLRKLAEKIKYRFVMMGAETHYQPEGIPYEHKTWSAKDEPEFLRSIDIGIMPLPPTKYSEAKGGYKLFMYMAAGIPSVATPIGINSQIIEDGVTGFLADSPKEWEEKLYLLATDPLLRQTMGKAARLKFEQLYDSRKAFETLNQLLTGMVEDHKRHKA